MLPPQEVGEVVLQCTGPNTNIIASRGSVPVGAPQVPMGWLTRVNVRQKLPSTIWSHGEVYVMVRLVRQSPPPGDTIVSVVWRGYVNMGVTEGATPSIPNIYVGGYSHWLECFAWFGSLRTASDGVVISGEVSDSPQEGTLIHDEPVGSGRGVTRIINLGDPAVSANYAPVVCPANVLWRLIGFNGVIVKDATAATRMPFCDIDDGTNAYTGTAGNGDATVSVTQFDRMSRGGSGGPVGGVATGTGQVWATPDCIIIPTHRVLIGQRNITAGDNWGVGFLGLEEWAGPQ